VATDLPEIREMFKGLKAGLLVPQKDSNELALAIDFLLENNEKGLKMGSTAQEIALNNYLWKHHTSALVSIFDSLI
jgi:glycosyltransferase involved in cell wall biosynthesis